MQNQSSQWLNVRRDRPDYMVMWGWGAMNPTAVKEAAKIRFPMDKFIGIWWSGGEDDARPAGDGAKGYKTLNFHAVGADFPALQDIKANVVDKGLSKVSSPDKVGENLYNRGVMNSVLIAEAIRTAQQLHRQGGRDRRGRPRRLREPRHHRGAPGGARSQGLHAAGQGDLRRTIPAATPSTSSSGTAPPGRRSPTGSSR